MPVSDIIRLSPEDVQAVMACDRVVQHEVDHLHGLLYPMRMRYFRNFGFTEVLFPGQAGTPG